MNKKILWIILLVVVIVGIIGIAIFVKPRDTSNDNKVGVSQGVSTNNSETQDTTANYQKVTLDDGILYSKDGKQLNADITIGTEYFDTTINDMYLNPSNYQGKNIQIEGLYLENKPYTFVGRYSSASVCPYCSGGFSYIEYTFDGDIEEELKDTENWIKLIGTWEKEKINYGTEENPYWDDYYHLKVSSFEIMNEKGEDTVKN